MRAAPRAEYSAKPASRISADITGVAAESGSSVINASVRAKAKNRLKPRTDLSRELI
jgi:hypothetical protein